MLRCNLKLSRNVMGAKLVEKFVALIVHHIVIADTATDKYLLYAGDSAKLSEKSQIFAFVRIHIFAGRGE